MPGLETKIDLVAALPTLLDIEFADGIQRGGRPGPLAAHDVAA